MEKLILIYDSENILKDYLIEFDYIKMDLKEFINNVNTGNIDNKIHDLIYGLGICARFKGYNYIFDAIKIVKDNSNVKITKDIYKVLAEKYNTKESNIESSIRKAIEKGFNQSSLNLVNEIFKNTICFRKGKPTNFEFIITLSKNV